MVRIPEVPHIRVDPDAFLERHNRRWGPGGTVVKVLWAFMVVTTGISIIFTIMLWQYSIYQDRDVTMMLIFLNLAELWLEVAIWAYLHAVYMRSVPTFGPLNELVGISEFMTGLLRPVTARLEEWLTSMDLKIDWGLRK
jgi:hypothetical protein